MIIVGLFYHSYLLFSLVLMQPTFTQKILRLTNAFRFIFQGSLMLFMSFFIDVFYFCINMYTTTQDHTDN